VRLPILEDWRPVLSLQTVVFGVQLMLLEPSVEYAVNQVAAAALASQPEVFREQVRCTLLGGFYHGVHFPRPAVPAVSSTPRTISKRGREELDAFDSSDMMDSLCLKDDIGSACKRARGVMRPFI
jgi:Ubiquitin-conjugating enzyme